MGLARAEARNLATIVRKCRQLLVEKPSDLCWAYHWLRDCDAYMSVVHHYQRDGYTLFQVAAILAYNDIHPLGAEALERLWEAIAAERVGDIREWRSTHELERN